MVQPPASIGSLLEVLPAQLIAAHESTRVDLDLSLLNLFKCSWSGEYVQCLLQGLQIVGAHEYGSGSAPPGENDSLVVMLDSIDHF